MSTFSPTSRQRQILKSLSTTTVMSVNALSRLTDVSGVTIRRDLAELAHKGLVTRVHGGALRAPRRGASQPISLRRGEDLEAKRVLARATAELIDDGESVIIDNGTTCEMVAEKLVGRDIRVLCLSLSAAAALASTPGPIVTVPGGIVEVDSEVALDQGLNALRIGACRRSCSAPQHALQPPGVGCVDGTGNTVESISDHVDSSVNRCHVNEFCADLCRRPLL